MTAQTDNPEVSNATEIVRLIEAADAFGEPDNYTGKREAKRYHDGMPLEVSTNPMRPSEAWSVSMHNVSEGGLSFWSKRDVPTGTPLFVRAFSEDEHRGWIPARVRHRTAGIRGHLIGTEFEKSPTSSEDAEVETTATGSRPDGTPATAPPSVARPALQPTPGENEEPSSRSSVEDALSPESPPVVLRVVRRAGRVRRPPAPGGR
ncbi:MAG: PilZ domain-containing protein [Planctomycetota bacterium]|jgi:hypothetical protein